MSWVLLVEDCEVLRNSIENFLSHEGFSVTAVGTASQAIELMNSHSFNAVVSDLKLPDKSGLEVVDASSTETPVVIMTAYGTIELAVKAMQKGAKHFLEKPFIPDQLLDLLNNFKDHKGPETKSFLTQSQSTKRLLIEAKKVAPLSSSVLITGESGTGKELIARFIHEHSQRLGKPFIPINCASMPADLLESELFGHEEGAFTGAHSSRVGLFEEAQGGTIFLDEIGDMPLELQVKLLRTLQDFEIKKVGSNSFKSINVRVIAATNTNIPKQIEKGSFREDLYYRLGVVIFNIPALRDRADDIELIARELIRKFARNFQQVPPVLSSEALLLLKSYKWPGNVRELENAIERAMIFSDDIILPQHLDLPASETSETKKSLPEISQVASKKAEIEAITRILAETSGNKAKAARLLGVSYKTLLNKVKEYSLN